MRPIPSPHTCQPAGGLRLNALVGVLALLILWVVTLAPPVRAERVSRTVYNPSNRHWYQLVHTSGISWPAAEAAARTHSLLGVQGHLVTITDGAEARFLYDRFPARGAWIGGYQPAQSAEPLGGWSWITGERWRYQRWDAGEPNDANGVESSHSYSSSRPGTWNDEGPDRVLAAYVVEYEPFSSPPDAAPGLLSASHDGVTKLRLQWRHEGAGVLGFRIERRIGRTETTLLAVVRPGARGYVDADVLPGTEYTYRVCAVNGSGEACSSPFAITTPGDPTSRIAFEAPVTHRVPGGETGYIHAADLDGDGHLDLAVGGATLSVLYGRGDGTLEEPIRLLQSEPYSDSVSQVITPDVDGDGDLDLVASDARLHRVVIFKNHGVRQFAAEVSFSTGTKPYGVTSGDFNGDALPDLATANDNSNDVGVHLNRGGGEFGPGTFYRGGSFPSKVVTADFDGDGDLDLAMANYVSADVRLYWATGDGHFEVGDRYPVGYYAAQLIIDDFNRDGVLDLATANTWGHFISILFGQGGGRFGPIVTHPGETYPHMMQSADLDGDGWQDLAAPNNHTDYFTVLRNAGGGSFGRPQRFASGGSNVRYLGIADLDEDGRPDVITANADQGTPSVHINRTPGPE